MQKAGWRGDLRNLGKQHSFFIDWYVISTCSSKLIKHWLPQLFEVLMLYRAYMS